MDEMKSTNSEFGDTCHITSIEALKKEIATPKSNKPSNNFTCSHIYPVMTRLRVFPLMFFRELNKGLMMVTCSPFFVTLEEERHKDN